MQLKKGEKECSHSGTWVQKGARGEGPQQQLDHSSIDGGAKKNRSLEPCKSTAVSTGIFKKQI